MKSTVTLKHTGGLQFVCESLSGHAIVLDGPPDVGGEDTGMRPTELLLVALGGCSGMDVASVLKKKRQNFTGLSVNVSGTKAESHPRRFTGIDVEFVVTGKGVQESAVQRAIKLSMEKYCSVKATIDPEVRINTSYRIIED